VKYCNERSQFGQQIGQFQMNQDMIASWPRRSKRPFLVYRAACRRTKGCSTRAGDLHGQYYAGRWQPAADFAMRILSAYAIPRVSRGSLLRDANHLHRRGHAISEDIIAWISWIPESNR